MSSILAFSNDGQKVPEKFQLRILQQDAWIHANQAKSRGGEARECWNV